MSPLKKNLLEICQAKNIYFNLLNITYFSWYGGGTLPVSDIIGMLGKFWIFLLKLYGNTDRSNFVNLPVRKTTT